MSHVAPTQRAALPGAVYLAALAFSLGVALDRDAGVRRWWALPMTFFIGLSFALPGHLWWRSAPRLG